MVCLLVRIVPTDKKNKKKCNITKVQIMMAIQRRLLRMKKVKAIKYAKIGEVSVMIQRMLIGIEVKMMLLCRICKIIRVR